MKRAMDTLAGLIGEVDARGPRRCGFERVAAVERWRFLLVGVLGGDLPLRRGLAALTTGTATGPMNPSAMSPLAPLALACTS